jgi:hypothetical protein
MTKLGFQLIQLKLTGSNVPDADVTFTQGLNVITGPSDTGKTFILQCIDYMLGGKNVPKPIPETKGYDSVILTIKKNADGEVFKLKRSLQKAGRITLSHKGDADLDLKQKLDGSKTDNISGFLLEILNLMGTKIRKNNRDETIYLSFRHLVNLSIISEGSIIREKSPIFKEDHSIPTVDKSVFTLLLSGIDDSELIEVEDPKISKVRINAKIEMLHDLVSQTQEQIEQQDIDHPLHILQTQLNELDSAYDKSYTNLALAEGSITEIEQERLTTWKSLCKIESRLNDLVGLDKRFELLDSQYNSDIRRLDAIVETSQMIDKMLPTSCPVCGSPAACHDKKHQLSHIDLDLIANSSLVEINLTKALITDLKTTVSDMSNEIEDLSSQQMTTQADLEDIDSKIQEQFRPKVKEALDATRKIQEQREDIRNVVSLFERINDFSELIKKFENRLKEIPVSQETHSVDPSYFRELCNEIELLLQAWNCPDSNRVEFNFNSNVWDITILGRDRKSHGKGVRALNYAAFTLALLRYCVTNNLPHPGFVIIDSPLVVYREPDPDEDNFTQDVKKLFFIKVASLFSEEQVIIMENEVPPEQSNYEEPINIIVFTKSKTGRFGFIPVLEEASE